MPSTFDPIELNSCLLRCLKIMYDLISIPQLSTLQPDVKHFLSAVLYILREIEREPAVLDNFNVEQEDGARRIFKSCATCLEELDVVCHLYKEFSHDVSELIDEEAARALCIDITTNPVSDIGDILTYLGYTLPSWLEDALINQERIGNRNDWTKSMSDNVEELQRRIDIAREFARINLATTSLQQHSTRATTAPPVNEIDGSCKGTIETAARHEGNEVWARVGETLAAEGVSGTAIERIERHLKDCVRNLVQGRIPHWESLDHNAADDSPTPSDYTTAESGHHPKSLNRPAHVVTTPRSAEAEIDKISPENYDSVAPKILEIALRSVKAFREVLRVLYESACREPDRAGVYARLAKYLQTHSTPDVKRSMPSSQIIWNGTSRTEHGPVASYLWNRCWADWNNGKHGRQQISTQNYALGLSCFIGQLVKRKMFHTNHVHILLQRLLQPDPPVDVAHFVALYHLMRTVGCIIEGSTRTSKDMDDHFERINAIIKVPEPLDDLFLLGVWIRRMRLQGWKAQVRHAEPEFLRKIVERLKNGLK